MYQYHQYQYHQYIPLESLYVHRIPDMHLFFIHLTFSRRCSGELHETLAENRQLLAERGQKLSALDTKTAQMESDAQDFASMARQIAEQERNKKWWQI